MEHSFTGPAYTIGTNGPFGPVVTLAAIIDGTSNTALHSEFIKGTVPAELMLKTSDITEALRFLLRVSPACVVPEIVFQRAGEAI